MNQRTLLVLGFIGGIIALVALWVNIAGMGRSSKNTAPVKQIPAETTTASVPTGTGRETAPKPAPEKTTGLPDKTPGQAGITPGLPSVGQGVTPTAQEMDFLDTANLDRLLQSTSTEEILPFVHNLPESTIRGILEQLPEDWLRQKLNLSNLGLSSEDLAQVKPADVILSLVRATKNPTAPANAPILFFTTQVNEGDNSPLSVSGSFAPNQHKIYACFRNEGTLANLSQVVIYWVNSSTGQVFQLTPLALNSTAGWNFVWVESKTDWETGSYTVSLLKSAKNPECLATGTFEVK